MSRMSDKDIERQEWEWNTGLPVTDTASEQMRWVNERRFAIVWIDDALMADILTGRSVLTDTDIPKGAHLYRVTHSLERTGFGLLFAHGSFEPVPPHSITPNLGPMVYSKRAYV